MPLPTGVKVEVEFTSGVWTDVTADFDYNVGYTIAVGRTTPSGQAQVSTCQVQLRNPLGKYTPGVQVLSDGTASPYYPNVQIRKRLRVSDSAGVQFVGGIKSWVPQTNGFTGSSYCVVSASDMMDRLSRVTMASPMRQEILVDAPTLYWPLTDPAGSTSALEQSGKGGSLTVVQLGTGGPLTFGDNGPGFGDGTGVKLAPSSVSNGQFLALNLSVTTFPALIPDSVEMWVNFAAVPAAAVTLFSVEDLGPAGGWATITVDSSGHVRAATSVSGPIIGASSIVDSGWHQIVLLNPGGGPTATLYVDGVSAGTMATSFTMSGGGVLRVGQAPLSTAASALPTCNIGQVAIGGLTFHLGGRNPLIDHLSAGFGWAGESVTNRIKRFLRYAAVNAADMNIDASTVTLGTYPQDGKNVTGACQDMAVSEGGGSVFYVQGGVAQFRSRTFRKPAAPVITVDMSLDADRAYQPSLDDQNLANSSTASRATASGTASQQTITDAVRSDPLNGEGLVTQDVTTYTTADADALALAQSIVAAGRAGWRLPRITIDLLTAAHNLYAAVQALVIGSRMRATVLPVGQAPSTQLDVIVEGWTRTVNVNTNSVAIDSSPADNPPRHVFDDVTYGRFQAQADCKLNAAITNSATTVVIASPTAPTFTTNPTMYPLDIQVGAEVITLTSAPGGAASPQTFTGVTRGAKGTTAAAQAINAQVQLYPASTFTL